MTPRKITVARLVELGACPKQVKLFRATFGEEVVVTRAAAVEHADKFSWRWAATHLLTASQRRIYAAAIAEAYRIYDAATAEAGRIFDAAIAEANRIYDAAKAAAFADAYNQEDST